MLLCLDVGNSQLFGGVYAGDRLLCSFRQTTRVLSSDELAIFLKTVLRENAVDPQHIQHVAVCSVVPHLDHTIRYACEKYLNITPFFLRAGVKTGLQFSYRNPSEIGSDLIATAIAAVQRYPKKALIIVDFGTATTLCALSADKEFLGGVILPGVQTSLKALQQNTAQLPSVDMYCPSSAMGQSTVESIQAGLYWGTLGACRELIDRFKQQAFLDQSVTVIATGGFCDLFAKEDLFNDVVPDLVLQGLYFALQMNAQSLPV